MFFIKIDEKEENGKDILLIATRDTTFQNSNMKEKDRNINNGCRSTRSNLFYCFVYLFKQVSNHYYYIIIKSTFFALLWSKTINKGIRLYRHCMQKKKKVNLTCFLFLFFISDPYQFSNIPWLLYF